MNSGNSLQKNSEQWLAARIPSLRLYSISQQTSLFNPEASKISKSKGIPFDQPAALVLYLFKISCSVSTEKMTYTLLKGAEERLWLLEESIANDSLPEFKELLHTLANWREEILNYFDYRISNGFVEGKNNQVKTMKRMAYGYRNTDNFRLRILATNPGSEVRVSHLLT